MRVIFFKLRQWYARAKTEYNENLQIMQEEEIHKRDTLLYTLQRENKAYTTREAYEEKRKKIKKQEVPKIRAKKMAQQMLETNERTSANKNRRLERNG